MSIRDRFRRPSSNPTPAAAPTAEPESGNGRVAAVAPQFDEYTELINEGVTIQDSAYGTMFYLTTGFHGLHVTGGLIAFLFVLGRTLIARKFTHEQAVSAIVVSYYWHFVDVVWIGLFAIIYIVP